MDRDYAANIILYDPYRDNAGKRLKQMILGLVPEEKAEIFHDIDELSRRLRQPIYGSTITVLLTGSREDLLELCMIRELLFNTYIILILPDHEQKTMTTGHLLRPSLMSYMDCYLTEVGAVLDKLLGDRQRR